TMGTVLYFVKEPDKTTVFNLCGTSVAQKEEGRGKREEGRGGSKKEIINHKGTKPQRGISVGWVDFSERKFFSTGYFVNLTYSYLWEII
ncbi:MAG: hypothetical protein RLZZ338_2751, partial [Cyanobacteriota bacterium]